MSVFLGMKWRNGENTEPVWLSKRVLGKGDEDAKQRKYLWKKKLYNECIAMRHQGKPVKRWWFVRRGKHVLDALEPDHNFLFSDHWFERFQNRYNISLRRKNHCSQKPPAALEPAVKKFHDREILVTLRHQC